MDFHNHYSTASCTHCLVHTATDGSSEGPVAGVDAPSTVVGGGVGGVDVVVVAAPASTTPRATSQPLEVIPSTKRARRRIMQQQLQQQQQLLESDDQFESGSPPYTDQVDGKVGTCAFEGV